MVLNERLACLARAWLCCNVARPEHDVQSFLFQRVDQAHYGQLPLIRPRSSHASVKYVHVSTHEVKGQPVGTVVT